MASKRQQTAPPRTERSGSVRGAAANKTAGRTADKTPGKTASATGSKATKKAPSRARAAEPGPAGTEFKTEPAAGPRTGVREPEPGRPEYRVEALAKGLRILSLFTEQRPTWRVSDISPAVGMPLPTVYRVVMTLTAEGYLDHLPNGDYRPGVRVLTLGTAALHSLDLVEIATPRLQALAASSGETVNLAVLTGDRVLYLIRLRNSDLVTANIQVGSTLPAVHTSIGKLLLAQLDEQDLAARVGPGSFDPSHGPNAKVSLDELRGELASIRADDWSLQDEELAFGLRSVAAPVRDASGRVVAGANIAVQSRDWSSQRIVRELRPMIMQSCQEISGLLGYRGTPQ
jgi:IclR family pca regulon transcriptional regulator